MGVRGSARTQEAENKTPPARGAPAAAERSRSDSGRGHRWLGTGCPRPGVCPVKRARAVPLWGLVPCTCALTPAPASLRSNPFLQETTPNKQLLLNDYYFILFYCEKAS